jgi:hypothetical protein
MIDAKKINWATFRAIFHNLIWSLWPQVPTGLREDGVESLREVDGLLAAEVPLPGVDFLKPFRPKFTGKTDFGNIWLCNYDLTLL